MKNLNVARICLQGAVIIALTSSDANAFWWLLGEGAVARAAAGAAVRGAAERSVAGAAARGAMSTTERRAVSGVTRKTAEGAAVTETGTSVSSIISDTKYCVRPVGESACDFHNASTAKDAVSKAVGTQYRLKPTNKPNVFEVLDAANNFKGVVEALDQNSDSSIEHLQQFTPISESNGNYYGYYQKPTAGAHPLYRDATVSMDFVDMAKVISSTPVYERISEPRQECWIETVSYVNTTHEQQIQRCRQVENYRDVVVGYNIVYRYNGRDVTARLPYNPGNTVQVGISVVLDTE